MSGRGRKVYIIGVGMTKFEKPFSRKGAEYFDYALEATTKALLDANITYDAVEFAAVGYCFGSTSMGQRSLYQLGMNQIPIVNTNNACASGSTAIYLARSQIEGGLYECTLALGFEKMQPGPLGGATPNASRGVPLGPLMERMKVENTQLNPQIFGNAGIEYVNKWAHRGATADHLNMVAEKNHRHSALNPYSQFQDVYSLEQVKNSRKVFGPVTLLQCCPTSDGAGCVILASEDFVKKHGLGPQAVEICAQAMATDSPKALLDEKRSAIELAGADMTRTAARNAFRIANITPDQVGAVELHDCFAPNELITYDALGIAPEGEAHNMLARGEFTHGGKCVVNPSGGLISKGHPLGATGLAQMCELTWQVRGWAGKRQVPGLKYALQHNVGLGGAVVVGIYKKAEFADGSEKDTSKWEDPRVRFGYNPAVEARRITEADFKRVVSAKGGVAGNKSTIREDVRAQL